MIRVKRRRGGERHLAFEGELTIYTAAEVKEQLAEQVREAKSLEADLSGVSELDTAGFQLLLAAKQACKAAGKELRFVMHSPAVLEVLELYGMASVFGDSLVLPAERGRDERADSLEGSA